MTKAQESILKRLADGWTLDRHGKDGMRGTMTRRTSEPTVIASAKTMNALLAEGLIAYAPNGVSEFEITKKGREALEKGR